MAWIGFAAPTRQVTPVENLYSFNDITSLVQTCFPVPDSHIWSGRGWVIFIDTERCPFSLMTFLSLKMFLSKSFLSHDKPWAWKKNISVRRNNWHSSLSQSHNFCFTKKNCKILWRRVRGQQKEICSAMLFFFCISVSRHWFPEFWGILQENSAKKQQALIFPPYL